MHPGFTARLSLWHMVIVAVILAAAALGSDWALSRLAISLDDARAVLRAARGLFLVISLAVLGAMAATPVRAKAAERALEGRPLDPANIAAAVSAAAEGTSPVDDSFASAWYRREVVGVHLRRLLVGQP